MTTPADDERSRPAYGEYATPEEQRARIVQSGSAAPDAVAPPVAMPAVPPAPQPWGARAARAPRPADRLATIVLLAFGAMNVLLSAMSYLNLDDAATQAMKMLGITGAFTNVDAARLWGVIAAVVLVAGFVVTAMLALRRLRTGRLTWWIPLVGAVATYLVVYVCILIPLLGDPAFVSFLSSR